MHFGNTDMLSVQGATDSMSVFLVPTHCAFEPLASYISKHTASQAAVVEVDVLIRAGIIPRFLPEVCL